jgi:polyisoprenoid-binding protein YceI
MATAVEHFNGVYDLDRAHSSVEIAIRHVQVSRFRASFGYVDARLTAAADTIALEGHVLAKSISITEPPDLREHVVQGSQFLDVDAHPLITFSSTSVELSHEGTATVSGELTIRGVSHPLAATGVYRPPRQDRYAACRARLELRSTVDRRSWDMDWQLQLSDGNDASRWEVEITARLEFVRTG